MGVRKNRRFDDFETKITTTTITGPSSNSYNNNNNNNDDDAADDDEDDDNNDNDDNDDSYLVQMKSPSLFPSPDPYRHRRCAKLYNYNIIRKKRWKMTRKITTYLESSLESCPIGMPCHHRSRRRGSTTCHFACDEPIHPSLSSFHSQESHRPKRRRRRRQTAKS